MQQIHTQLHIKATPAQVFDAWLVPRLLGQWLFPGHADAHAVLRMDLDPREGGDLCIQTQHGDAAIRYSGSYLEIEHPHRLAFTWTPETPDGVFPGRVQLEVTASGDGSHLALLESVPAMTAGHAHFMPLHWSKRLGALSSLFS